MENPTAFHFKILWEEVGFEKYSHFPVFYEIKVFLAFFLKKNAMRRLSFSRSVTPVVKVWGRSLRKQKSCSRDRVGPFNHSGALLLTLYLKMAEIGVFQCSRRTSIPLY